MKGIVIDDNSGVLECPECKMKWTPLIKPQSGGEYESKKAEYCPTCPMNDYAEENDELAQDDKDDIDEDEPEQEAEENEDK